MAPRRTSSRTSLPDLSKYGSLAEYNRKRHFGITPEPAGKLRREGEHALAFIVQKHAASHLHYDFRLEYRGVMLSWAVPKGPSLDPSIKRLAMRTEDHPIDYNQFEGVIPEGEYGGGTVMIWDKGTWTSEDESIGDALARGQLKFTLHGEKLQGSFVLVRTGDPRHWILIKHRDEFATTRDLTTAEPRSVVSRRDMRSISETAGGTERQIVKAIAADQRGSDSARAAVVAAARRTLHASESVDRATRTRTRAAAATKTSTRSGLAPKSTKRSSRSAASARTRRR